MNNKWIALIPAYQPAPLMLALLEKVKRSGFEIVVVNDGSDESADELFSKAKEYATVLTHPENLGKGRAIKTGLKYIITHFSPDCTIVTMDADGQHTESDAENICKIADEHPDWLVLGSRMLKENVPLRSQFGNSVTRLVYRLSTGVKLRDTQTGLRAFSLSLAKRLVEIPGERYEYEMNVLLYCPKEEIPVFEHGIETIYINGNSDSHFDTIKDSYRIYKEILKFSASSFLSFLIDYILFSILSLITSGITASVTISNIGARVISSSVNYTLNKRLVFKSRESVAKTALQYFALAAAILAGNTLVLNFLTDYLSLNRYIAKLITELLFFIISWLVQRLVIFRKKEEES
ncbi:MAG: bifunctional glycosyltransferase family 2/GtrA family protein [Ruminococcus sp.]|nr:bifunctional glycosyltransferase family 2/GtrA family protein [Ruminococcus sp.]